MRQPEALALVRDCGPCTISTMLASIDAPNSHAMRASVNRCLGRLEAYGLVRRTVPEDLSGGHAEHIWEAVE